MINVNTKANLLALVWLILIGNAYAASTSSMI